MLYLIQSIDEKDMAIIHLDKGFVSFEEGGWTHSLKDFILTPPLHYKIFDSKDHPRNSIETYIALTNEDPQDINIRLLAVFNTEEELSNIPNSHPELLL